MVRKFDYYQFTSEPVIPQAHKNELSLSLIYTEAKPQ